MKILRRNGWTLLAGLGLALSSGCQTWEPNSGLTLPTPYYLRHAPTYFPPSPSYPLPKELKSLEDAGKAAYDNPGR
jgi:hypothetical protein